MNHYACTLCDTASMLLMLANAAFQKSESKMGLKFTPPTRKSAMECHLKSGFLLAKSGQINLHCFLLANLLGSPVANSAYRLSEISHGSYIFQLVNSGGFHKNNGLPGYLLKCTRSYAETRHSLMTGDLLAPEAGSQFSFCLILL